MSVDAPGMRGYRPRNDSGPLREKRGDTHISTIEQKYGLDLGVRGDMHLDTYLEGHNLDSLHDLVHAKRPA